jgi:hypothetical protein
VTIHSTNPTISVLFTNCFMRISGACSCSSAVASQACTGEVPRSHEGPQENSKRNLGVSGRSGGFLRVPHQRSVRALSSPVLIHPVRPRVTPFRSVSRRRHANGTRETASKATPAL